MASLFRSLAFAQHGYRYFLADGFERAKLAPLPETSSTSLRGCECIVTGASRGIGFEVARSLVARGASVHVVCRDAERGATALAALREARGTEGGEAHLHVADLSSLAQIRGFVERYTSSGKPLHALVCNAGVMRHRRAHTSEGYEYNFAVNTLGTHVLMTGLRPVLGRTAREETNRETSCGRGAYYTPRVIVVSSGGMLTEALEVKDLEFKKVKNFDAVKQYARGKRHQVALAEHWAGVESANAGADVIKSGKGYVGYYSMHPGWVDTPGVADALPKFHQSMRGKLRTPAQGADTIMYLLTEDAKKLRPGAFYFDREPRAKHFSFGFTRYEPKHVQTLLRKLNSIAAEGSVRSENQLRATNSARSLANFHHRPETLD